ncbi:DUF1016 domain-containing protein [Massilia atriviolacea]
MQFRILVGNQARLSVSGKPNVIDTLFYHTMLRCVYELPNAA